MAWLFGESKGKPDEELYEAAGRGDVAKIERQIAAGADPNAFEGTGGLTPLQCAGAYGHVAAIAALLKAGARVDGVDSDGTTPLIFAAANGRTAAIDALVAVGADVHRADKDGDTALHRASVYGFLDAARVLLEAGAKTDVCNKDGERPIDVVRAQLARSLRLLDCGTPLRRRVAMRRFALRGAVWTNPMRPPCARCWSGRLP
jgi:ankyrin repeat protein